MSDKSFFSVFSCLCCTSCSSAFTTFSFRLPILLSEGVTVLEQSAAIAKKSATLSRMGGIVLIVWPAMHISGRLVCTVGMQLVHSQMQSKRIHNDRQNSMPAFMYVVAHQLRKAVRPIHRRVAHQRVCASRGHPTSCSKRHMLACSRGRSGICAALKHLCQHYFTLIYKIYPGLKTPSIKYLLPAP